MAWACGGSLISSTSIETAAKLLSEGGIVAIYTRGMEYGPRALGARTIMASPTDAEINREMTNICRCGTYPRIRAAIHRAAELQA